MMKNKYKDTTYKDSENYIKLSMLKNKNAQADSSVLDGSSGCASEVEEDLSVQLQILEEVHRVNASTSRQ